jgi:hypothetical protein
MVTTIYQRLKDGASAERLHADFQDMIQTLSDEFKFTLGVDLLSPRIMSEMRQELDDEITRAESRINKEDNKALENKRKEFINSCIDYLAAAAHDNTILELKGDEALEEFYPILASIEEDFISTWNVEKAKSEGKVKKPITPDELIANWIKSI